MKDNIEELLKKALHEGEIPTAALNQEILKKVKRDENTKQCVKNGNRKNKLKPYYWKPAQIAAAFAVTLLVGSTVTFAAVRYFGLDYFTKQSGGRGIDKQMESLIDKDPSVTVQNKNTGKEILDYQVQEVLCDSDYMVATLRISLKNPEEYLLLPETTDVTDPVSGIAEGKGSSQSIEDYCRRRHLTPVSVYMDFDSSSESTIHKTMSDSKQTGSGELSVIVAGKRLTRDKMFTVHLQPSLVFHAGSKNTTVCNDSTLKIRVTDKSTAQSADYRISSEEAAKLSDTLIQQIKGITLKSTEVGTYLTVTYESAGSSDDATGTFIDLCDKNGNVIPGNVIAGGTCKENGDHSFTCENCYEDLGLPEEIYLSIGDGKQILKAEKAGENHGKRGYQ